MENVAAEGKKQALLIRDSREHIKSYKIMLAMGALQIPIFPPMAATVIFGFSAIKMRRNHLLKEAEILKNNGYEVILREGIEPVLKKPTSVLKDYWFTFKNMLGAPKRMRESLKNAYLQVWEDALSSLASKSDDQTTTLILYSSHGSMEKGTSYLPHENGVSDIAFLNSLSKIKGSKVVVINSCRAGGFVKAAESLPEDEKEKLVVVTASKERTTMVFNPMNKIVAQIAAKDEKKPFIEEFNSANSKVGRAKKFITKYRPQAFVGSAKAAKITI